MTGTAPPQEVSHAAGSASLRPPLPVLAADIAHELANLMVVIHGHTALLDTEQSAAERSAGLAAINEASARAVKLTRQLRALIRIQQIDERHGS